tara:strand:+ start:931 stop:1218 length:288 start_codon:yes stop_codon:yes gene_type:complete
VNFLERQLEDPICFARIKRWFYISLVVIALVEGLVLLAPIALPKLFPHEEHHHFRFESIPAFGSLYGLVSCVAIIVISKFLGKVWLMRREDHYES